MRRNSSKCALVATSLACLSLLAACNTTPLLRYVAISPTTALISVGTTQQFTATLFYSDGSTKDGTAVVTWSSSKQAVATIGAGGVATAVGPGTTTITANAGGPSGSATLNVNQLDSIVVTPANPPAVPVGNTLQFTATGTFTNPDGSQGTADITGQVTWSSNSSSTCGGMTVATISSSGLATAVASGCALITASLNGVAGSTTMTVGAATAVSLVVSPANPTLAIGNATTFTAQELWSDNSVHPLSGTVTWASGTPAAAGILSSSGIAAAFAAGQTTITATEGSLTGNTTLTVVVGTAKYAYVANNGGGAAGADNIEWYSVDVTSATPFTSPNTTSPGAAPAQVILHPSLKYLYHVDSSGNIYVWNVGAGGALTTSGIGPAVGGSGASTDSYYGVVDPYGRFFYIVDSGLTTINGFNISQTDGSLTQMSGATFSFPSSLNQPQEIVMDHTGSYLYAVNFGNNTVSGYSIDQTSGALTELSPATVATGNGPQFAALDPAGTHLYVANSVTDNSITMIPIGSGGALGTPVTTATISGATSIANVIVDPSGTHLYALDSGTTTGQVYGFNLNSDGTVNLTPISTTPIATGDFPFFNMIIDPTGALLATANNFDGPPGTISLFAIGAGGTLTADTPATAGNAPEFVIFYNSP